MAVNILNELLADKLGLNKKSDERALKLFEEQEKLKQKYSETAASMDKLNELFNTLGITQKQPATATDSTTVPVTQAAPTQQQQPSMVVQQPMAVPVKQQVPQESQQEQPEEINQDAMKMSVLRGVVKKNFGIELPETQTEKDIAIKDKIKEESALTEAKKKSEQKVKLDEFLNEYDNFRNLNAVIQPFRSTGGILQNIKAGATLSYKGAEQKDPLGYSVAGYDGAVKRLRVVIARLKDVGNLSATEQVAAQAIIPGLMDAQSTAELKDAYLRDIANASLEDEKLPQDRKKFVKEVIGKWMKTKEWKDQVSGLWKAMPASERIRRSFDSVEKAEQSDVPVGTLITVNGRLAIKE